MTQLQSQSYLNCTAAMTTKRVFQLIDLDRTLFDTARFAKLITDEINKTQPGLGDELDAQFEAAYKKEETFASATYVSKWGIRLLKRWLLGLWLALVRTPFMPGAKERAH